MLARILHILFSAPGSSLLPPLSAPEYSQAYLTQQGFLLKEGLTIIHLFIQFFGEGTGTPLQYSCLENPMDGGAW